MDSAKVKFKIVRHEQNQYGFGVSLTRHTLNEATGTWDLEAGFTLISEQTDILRDAYADEFLDFIGDSLGQIEVDTP